MDRRRCTAGAASFVSPPGPLASPQPLAQRVSPAAVKVGPGKKRDLTGLRLLMTAEALQGEQVTADVGLLDRPVRSVRSFCESAPPIALSDDAPRCRPRLAEVRPGPTSASRVLRRCIRSRSSHVRSRGDRSALELEIIRRNPVGVLRVPTIERPPSHWPSPFPRRDYRLHATCVGLP